jgi:hypothetical protein
MPMPNQRFHNYVEGKGAGRYAPWLLRRWHGTPDWLKKYGGMYAGSYAGKGINEGYGEDGAGCD